MAYSHDGVKVISFGRYNKDNCKVKTKQWFKDAEQNEDETQRYIKQ